MRGRRHSENLKLGAIRMREQGRSLHEIAEELRLPKNTVQTWVHHVKLTHTQHRRLEAKWIEGAARGRPLAVLAWQRKIETWKDTIRSQVNHLASLPFTEPNIAKLTCGLLYICEGGKYPASRHVSFANTDPRMIRLFLTLLRHHFPIEETKFRVRIMHRWDQDGANLGKFWSHTTGIPLRQFYPPYADRRTKGQPTRRTDYRGICHINYFSTTLQYQLQAIGESVLDLAEEKERRKGFVEPTASLLGEAEPPSYKTLRFVAFPEREELLPLQRQRLKSQR